MLLLPLLLALLGGMLLLLLLWHIMACRTPLSCIQLPGLCSLLQELLVLQRARLTEHTRLELKVRQDLQDRQGGCFRIRGQAQNGCCSLLMNTSQRLGTYQTRRL